MEKCRVDKMPYLSVGWFRSRCLRVGEEVDEGFTMYWSFLCCLDKTILNRNSELLNIFLVIKKRGL